jgi:ADP-heptose:LPS heptosyltransferase
MQHSDFQGDVQGAGELVPDVRRLGVLRANAIGDYLVSVPALAALRAAYPDAEIVLLGQPWHRDFLTGRPGPVDRVVPVPVSTGVREPGPGEAENPEEQRRFFAEMQVERFDLAVQLHGGGRYSNPFIRRLGARVTAGLRTPDAEELDRWTPYVYYQPEVFRFLEAVSQVGAPPVLLEPEIALTPADRAEADAALDGVSDPVAVLHPGARDPRRRWPASRFAEVGDALAAAGACVVVTGSGEERSVVREVVATMRTPVRPLVARLTLGGLAGVLERAAVVVANDTGPRHLAAAVGTATASIYWCGNLINAGPISRTRHRPHVAWTVRCPLCAADMTDETWTGDGPGGCQHNVSFVDTVQMKAVLADALDLLAREDGRWRGQPRPGQEL